MDSQKVMAVLSVTSPTRDVHLHIIYICKIANNPFVQHFQSPLNLEHTSPLTHVMQTQKSFQL